MNALYLTVMMNFLLQRIISLVLKRAIPQTCAYIVLRRLLIYIRTNLVLYLFVFLDASKAFDKINYWLLFDKLIKRDVPLLFNVRFVSFWYAHQQVCVQWGKSISGAFSVLNGVKQGGILSPLFFNIYLNDLSIQLKNACVGCNINDNFLNHFIYADDMCLISPSPNALQTLLNICNEYAMSHDIVFNTKKTMEVR